MRQIITVFLFIALMSCTKSIDPTPTPNASKPIFEKYSWTEAIDSLKGQYFNGIVSSKSSELFVNLWKGWNGGGPLHEPTTLLSFDNGNTWQTVSDGNGLPRTWTYVQRHTNSLFAGTPDKGLFRSDDNGSTWQQSTTNNWIWPEVIKSNDSRLIISDFRLEKTYASPDNGLTWQLIYPAFLRVLNISSTSILAMNRGVILESNDWGNTWTTDNSLNVLLGGNQGSLGLVKKADTLIVAVQKGVYIKKTSTLEPWKKISDPIEMELGLFFEIDGKILVQEQFSNILYYTDDGGKTWKNYGSMNGPIWNIAKSGKYIFASGYYGLFKRQIQD